MSRKAFMLVASAVVATLLAGCTGIPYSGQVNKGVPAVNDITSDIQYLPAGPSEGASPEQVLRGFVDAGTSPSGDWKIARQYLSTAFARSWDPRAGVVVDSGTRTVLGAPETGLTMVAQVQARVDTSGSYVEESTPRESKYVFGFVQEAGQWRISSAPSGIIIDGATFPRVFSATPLFFYANGSTTLIPDLRWFPARASTSTRVVQALMQGPSPWLNSTGSVVTALPAGAQLMADSVPVESGVASVNLDARSVTISPAQGNRILRQVASSLVGVAGVSAVSLYFSGNPAGQLAVPTLQSLLGPKANAPTFLSKDGSFGYFDGTIVTPMSGDLSAQIAALKPESVVVAADRTKVVLTSARGVYRLGANRPRTVVDVRPDVLPASMDADQNVWTIQRGDASAVRITPAQAAARTLALPWGKGSRISVLSISPDGSRLVAALNSGEGNRVCTASIGRNQAGIPVKVGPCKDLLAPRGGVTSGAWIDGLHFALLSSTNLSGASSVRVFTLGGRFADITPPAGKAVLGGLGANGALRVLTADGNLFEQTSASRWATAGSRISLVATVQ